MSHRVEVGWVEVGVRIVVCIMIEVGVRFKV